MLAPIALSACLAIAPAAEQITVADLAPRFPGLAGMSGELPLAPAPAPGAARVFHMPDLRRLAARFALNPPGSEICVQRPLAPLDAERVSEAMHKALPQAEISILEISPAPAPEGELEFPLALFHDSPAGALWNGYVRYGLRGRFAVWARAKVRVMARQVVANSDLPPGGTITADLLREETRAISPAAADFAKSIDQVTGTRPRLAISAGSAIRFSQLLLPPDVMRGEIVHVAVQRGQAHLDLEARAEQSARIGEIIPLRNLDSQRLFRARIAARGRALVEDTRSNP